MARPTVVYDWATNTNYSAGPASGTVTKVQPMTIVEQDGWRPDDIPPPQYQNYWQNAVAQHLDYLWDVIRGADTLDPAPSIVRAYSGAIFKPHPAAAWSEWINGSTGGWTSDATNSARILKTSLNAILPEGATITNLEAMVNPGAARTGTDRMLLEVRRSTWDTTVSPPTDSFATPVQVYDDATANQQMIVASAISQTIDKDNTDLEVYIYSGQTGAAADEFLMLEITYNNPGPHN